ncbi:hypothetical protein [Streptomyces erythrochromogenes]|uniref:hypothetical protein n=1 Tax=Streptomyces erythrochromogenes TaxID=285574 RepID=UPI0037D0FE22
MGMQERWQSRQSEMTARNEARDAKALERHDAVVEDAESVIVTASIHAFERGDGWFEAEVDQRSTSGWSVYGAAAVDFGGPAPTKRETTRPRPGGASPRSDLLSRIEDEGWSLHTAQYVYVHLSEESRSDGLLSKDRVAVKGKIVGLYLFRRAR